MNSAWMTVEVCVGLLTGLGASIAVARVLGPRELGFYGYLLWAITAVSGAAGLGLPVATRKYAAEYLGADGVRTALAMVRHSRRLQAGAAAFTTLAAIGVAALVAGPEHSLTAMLAAICIAPTMMLEIPTAASAAAQRYRAVVVPSIVAALMNVAGMALSLILGWGLAGLAASLLLARCVDLALREWFFRGVARSLLKGAADPPASVDPGLRDRMRRFRAEAALLQVLELIVWDRSEVFFLERYCDMREVAFYTVPFNITAQALLFARSFSSSASANLMMRVGEDLASAKAQVQLVLRYLALLILPALLGLAAISRPLVEVLYGAAFAPAATALAILCVASITRAALLPLRFALAAFEAQRWAVGVLSACALLNISLNVALIPGAGATGAAIANGLAQGAAACGLLLALTLALRIDLPWGGIARIALAATGAAAPAAILSLTSPAWMALAAGIPCSGALYFALLRVTRAVEANDIERFEMALVALPAPVRNVAVRVVRRLVR